LNLNDPKARQKDYYMEIEQAVEATNEHMFNSVASDISVLEEASRHILIAGGKRVRPKLLFLSYQAVGGTDLSSAVPLAAAVELVHTATLVHDDINDHGRVRRGRATVNEKWGRTFALLTGDFLFTKVYSLMAPYKDLNRLLAEATVALVEGETLQAYAVKTNNLNREIYQQIVAKKTASLFRAAAALGAEWGGGGTKESSALGDFGFYLGLAFQIIDDLLDLTGDAQLVGKDTGIDLMQGKGVGTVYAHETGSAMQFEQVMIAPEQTVEEDDPFAEIKRRLIADGAIDEGKQMAQIIAVQARRALEGIPHNSSVDQLNELLTLVLDRQN
jgi:geranylgeranyl pyrophosphate synthase